MDEVALRRKRIQDAMANAVNPRPIRPALAEERLRPPSVMPSAPTEPVPAKPSLPTPAVNIDPSAAPPPTPEQPSTLPQQPIRVSTPIGGLSALEKAGAVLQAKREAGVSSPVRVEGEEIITDAPKMHKGDWKDRLKVGLKNAVVQMGEYARNNPNASPAGILTAGAAGGGIGAVKPVLGDEMLRRAEIQQDERDLARQAAIQGVAATARAKELEPELQAEKIRTEAEIANEKLRIEELRIKGQISDKDADRRLRELTLEETQRHNRTTEDIQRTTAGTRGQETPANQQERERKFGAAKAEYDQLVGDETEAGRQKNEAYATVEELKKKRAAEKSYDRQVLLDDEIDRASAAARDLDKVYQGFAEKKRDAQRRMRENEGAAQSSNEGTYSGRTMSQSNLIKYAASKGISVKEAREQVEAQGVKIR